MDKTPTLQATHPYPYPWTPNPTKNTQKLNQRETKPKYRYIVNKLSIPTGNTTRTPISSSGGGSTFLDSLPNLPLAKRRPLTITLCRAP